MDGLAQIYEDELALHTEFCDLARVSDKIHHFACQQNWGLKKHVTIRQKTFVRMVSCLSEPSIQAEISLSSSLGILLSLPRGNWPPESSQRTKGCALTK